MDTKAAQPFTRRTFLQKTAAACLAASAPQIVPSSVLGAEARAAPSNRITTAFIGTGDHGMGWNLPPYLKHKSAQVVAVCDVDGKRMHRAKETVDDRYKNED